MQQEPTEGDRQARFEQTNPLPAAVAESLTPTTRHALMHWMRRRILRTLSEDKSPKTTQHLLATFPGASLRTVTYHVLVLEHCGGVRVSGQDEAHGTITRFFVSAVTDDAEFTAALDATARLDAAV